MYFLLFNTTLHYKVWGKRIKVLQLRQKTKMSLFCLSWYLDQITSQLRIHVHVVGINPKQSVITDD